MALDPDWIARLGPPYRPGSGRTPPRAAFEAVRATVSGPAPAAALVDHPAYRLAADLEAAGYSWEAHEVLEALWLAATPNSRERHLLQGLIQRANARLKMAMGMPAAAIRLFAAAADHFHEARGLPAIDVDALHVECLARANPAGAKAP